MQLQRIVVQSQAPGVAGVSPALLATAVQYVPSLQANIASARAVADARVADEFPRLLLDLYLCRAITGAHLENSVALDPRLAEDLVGKTWRAEELEPVGGLELVQVGSESDNDGEFWIATSYLVDLDSREIYAERQITPARLRSAAPKVQHRVRLVVVEAGLYPGLAPRRIRLGRFTRAPLRDADVDQLVDGATHDVSEIQRRLVERASVPFGQSEVAVLFRPAVLLGPPEGSTGPGLYPGSPGGAVDVDGRFVALDWSRLWVQGLDRALPADEVYAIFGLASQTDQGISLRCLSIVGARAVSSRHAAVGRIFPPI